MTRVPTVGAQGAMSNPGGLGLFTRMLRKSKLARRAAQPKLDAARGRMQHVHLRYINKLHRKKKRLTMG